jgi:hypothetical protein
MQKTEFLVIALTTAAIIAAVTTVSISAATPAFAKLNCNENFSICTGGAGGIASGSSSPGGFGGRVSNVESTSSGGAGGQFEGTGGTLVGGGGSHSDCGTFPCQFGGGGGQHLKGPGGNSDNVPPP